MVTAITITMYRLLRRLLFLEASSNELSQLSEQNLWSTGTAASQTKQ
jgi:hypothetical protein